MADLMKTELEAELALKNGGCLRANKIFDSGPMKLRFMNFVFPIVDDIRRIKIKGSLFVQALENAV